MKSLFILIILIFLSCSTTKRLSSTYENLVETYIDARNKYDVEKVSSLIDENYNEKFIDGSVEIQDKKQLEDHILWGKELDSNIKLLEIKSNREFVTTIEENTNYLDIALKRKKRKFKITYVFEEEKILSQKIDTLVGYGQVSKFNAERYKEFVKYCEQNKLDYHNTGFNQESGIHLRSILEQYQTDMNKK